VAVSSDSVQPFGTLQRRLSPATGYNVLMLVANTVLAADDLSPKVQGQALLLMIVVCCLVGVIVIILLLSAWRRYNERLRHSRPEPQVLSDPWKAAADRLEPQDLPGADESDDDDSDDF
jgi:hypothetical protein